MSTLTGQLIANSYRQLLQTGNNNVGLGGGGVVTVQDGNGVTSPLQLSQTKINLGGIVEINGVQLNATAAQLNTAAAGAASVTGMVAESGGSKYGRTLVASTGVTITNASGLAGNPTFALENTSVSAGVYGPMNTLTVDAQGRITDVTATTTISANAFVGGTLSGSSLYVENNVSVSGSLFVANAMNVAGATSIASTLHIDGATSISNDLNIAGTFTAAGPAIVKNVTTSVVSATFLYGDGSNITGLAGAGTMTALNTTGTGIYLTENGTTVTGITGSGTLALNSNQEFSTVSATTIAVSNNLIVNGSATFADNVPLHFGTDKDLTIQHNGSNSLITDSGTGNLFIQSNEIRLTNTGSFSMLTLTDGQDADFPYGVQVSGTVSATAFVGPTITSINNTIAAVSAVTSVNSEAITSINAVLGSGNYATTSQLAVVSAYATSITEALSATLATSIANHLPLAGGTMTGAITLPGNPSSNLEAATKQYVDNLTAAAIHFHDAVRLESPVNLNATYNNGTAGVGATLTNAGTQTALVIDGVAAVVADRVLIYQQTDQTQNGVYTVTDIGSGSTNWVLTRATDADSYAPGTNSGLDEGSYFYVQEGDTGAGEAYVCNTVGTITFGTTNITFAQFSSALVYSAGTGININASRVISTSGVATDAALTALSATMATSIDNTNTNLTALSATMATSIDNSNTNITANTNSITSVNSAITSVSNVITALSATLATSISNHLPLSGGTITGTISATDIYTSAVAIGVDNLLGKQLHIGTAAVADIVSLTDAASITVDFNNGQNFAVQLTNNRTIENPTNCVPGQVGSIFVIQDGTGSRTLSFGSNWKFIGGTAPTLSTDVSSVDRIDYIVYTSTAVQAIASLDIK